MELSIELFPLMEVIFQALTLVGHMVDIAAISKFSSGK